MPKAYCLDSKAMQTFVQLAYLVDDARPDAFVDGE